MQRNMGEAVSGEVGRERGASGGSEETLVRTEPESRLSGGRKYLSQRCVWCGEFHIEECAAEMEINRWKEKYRTMRRYVREANRGAFRSSLALEVATHRNIKKAKEAQEWYERFLEQEKLVEKLKRQVTTLGEAMSHYNAAHLPCDNVNDCGGCRACY